jgi:cytochrome b involved in lipid metabolism
MAKIAIMTLLSATLIITGCASQPSVELPNQDTTQTQETTTPEQETTTTADQLPTYTLADIAIHNTAESCWTAIKGNVYDMTAFISQHPGGERGILKTCGKDGTQDFLGAHSRGPAEKSLTNFIIGTLAQ